MKIHVVNSKYYNLVQDIRSYFKEATQSIWDRRNKIKIVEYANQEITVKSFKIPHFINKIAYTFIRPSKAARSYENSLKIKAYVPQAIGYIEFKKFGLVHESYYLCEYYAYHFTIRDVLTQKNFDDKENIFRQFAVFTHALHEEGVEHLDYSPGNILIKKISNEQYEFKIIDVNRMIFKDLNTKERLENFAKLWANDDDLKYIIETYAKLSNIESKEAVNIALEASQNHKNKVNLKKKIKGKKVVY